MSLKKAKNSLFLLYLFLVILKYLLISTLLLTEKKSCMIAHLSKDLPNNNLVSPGGICKVCLFEQKGVKEVK